MRYTDKTARSIRAKFTAQTGVPLRKRSGGRMARTAALAAVIALLFTATAAALDIFSPLSGDDFALGAVYEGGGIVTVRVENRADKELKFQKQLRLMHWDTGEEIAPVSGGRVRFENTAFAPHSEGVMTLDLSDAYGIDALDAMSAQGGYYLVLTNANFVFGQDWICFISAAEEAETAPETVPEASAAPPSPAETDAELVSRVEETLRPYFALTGDITQRRAQNPEYYAACAELLAPLGERAARPAPSDLVIDRPGGDVIFDPGVPADAQHLLTSENHTPLDAYGLPVAAAPEETALVLSALVPQRPGETDGGAPIPVAYLFTYFRTDIEKADCVFVHGQLVPLAEIEDRRVYEDEQYVCYELSAYFYTDVLAHAEALCAARGDVCWDAAAQRRVENIHACFTDPAALSALIRHAAA